MMRPRFFHHRSALVLFAIWISLPLPMWHVWMHDGAHSHEGHAHGIVSHALGAVETTRSSERSTAAADPHRQCGGPASANACSSSSTFPTLASTDCAWDPADDASCLYCELGQSFAQFAVRAEQLSRAADESRSVVVVLPESIVRPPLTSRASRAPPLVPFHS